MKIKVEAQRDSRGRPRNIIIDPDRGKSLEFNFQYDKFDLISEFEVKGPRDLLPGLMPELVKLITPRTRTLFMDFVEELNTGAFTVGPASSEEKDAFGTFVPKAGNILICVHHWIGTDPLSMFECDLGLSFNKTRLNPPVTGTVTEYFSGFSIHKHNVEPYVDNYIVWFPTPIRLEEGRPIYAHAIGSNVDSENSWDVHFAIRLIIGKEQ